MKIGSLVECVEDFSDLAAFWGFNYPDVGDVLTVNSIAPHSVFPKELIVLTFDELPGTPPLCWKTYKGEYNFKELAIPDDLLAELIEEPLNQF